MNESAVGTFEIELRPGPAEVDGRVDRFEFDKSFSGDLDATSRGVMLSSGDPSSGTAGYVAMEAVTGRLAGRVGSFTFAQFGRMLDGSTSLQYRIVAGSGSDALAGITGELDVTIDDGTHHYRLTYELPD